MNVQVTSTKLIIDDPAGQIVFNGQDIIKAVGTIPALPALNTAPVQGVVTLTLTGSARDVFGDTYPINLAEVQNQPTWIPNTLNGALVAAEDIRVMIRSASGGGGGGQVDTIVPGDAIDVDSTDPANPIVNVKVDGVTIGINGSNELEVPAGGGGYVVGPGSATDDHVALFDGATGNLIKDSGYTPGGLVIPTGFGDIDLIETSPGFWPVEVKGGLDGDGTLMQSNTGSFQVNVNPKNSIEIDAAQVQLVGDEAAPGNSEYYGTDGSGTKGFHPIPAPAGAALTRTDDTNVTLTLGGSPSTALLAAASITAGWTGQLSIARGGTNAATEAAALTNLGIIRAALTSAFVSNSASFVDVTGMALTVPAGKKAKFTFYVPYSSATTTVGIGLSMTVTGSPLLRHFTRFTPTNGTGTPVRAMITTDDAGAVNATTGAASTNYGIEMNGVVVADASPCVVQLRVAVGGTPANITLSAGSVMMATLID